jgi:hypothetical protein
MPITIVDYVKSIVGDKPAYDYWDFYGTGVAMIDGCERCYAMLFGYNAYPSKSGSCRCADCIGDTGFATVAEFTASTPPLTCPACGNGQDFQARALTIPDPETYSFTCGKCGWVWLA